MIGKGQELDYRRKLERSEVHDILRNDRRRRTIERLRENGGGSSVVDLSESIAAAETGESPPPRDARKSVYVSLHQTHLPKLDDLGVVEYDQQSKEITLQEPAREVAEFLDVGSGPDAAWSAYYLGLSVLAMVTVFAAKIELFPSGLDIETWAFFFFSLFAVSALYQVWNVDELELPI